MLSISQLTIAGFYNISFGNVENWYLSFLTKKSMCFIMKTLATLTTPLFKTRIEAKRLYQVLELNQSQWLKTYAKFNTQNKH